MAIGHDGQERDRGGLQDAESEFGCITHHCNTYRTSKRKALSFKRKSPWSRDRSSHYCGCRAKAKLLQPLLSVSQYRSIPAHIMLTMNTTRIITPCRLTMMMIVTMLAFPATTTNWSNVVVDGFVFAPNNICNVHTLPERHRQQRLLQQQHSVINGNRMRTRISLFLPSLRTTIWENIATATHHDKRRMPTLPLAASDSNEQGDSSGDSPTKDDNNVMLEQQYAEFEKILPFVKQRASPELIQEYDDKLSSSEETWYDRPDLQEEFLMKVEQEQISRMVELEQAIQSNSPDMYEYYASQAQQLSSSSLLTASPSSDSSSLSLAIEHPDLMIRMEQEYTIWNLIQNEIKELAPDLYKEVIDELTREQQDQEEEVKLLSTILMERQDLIQKVNTKVNFLRRSVEDITEAVMKKPKKKKKGGGKTSNKGFGGGFGK